MIQVLDLRLMTIKCFDIPSFADSRGVLTAVEDQLPFAIKRAFWITDADGQRRGGHGHKQTRQATIAIKGRVDMLMDNGQDQATIILDRPDKCLIIEPEYWHEMTFHAGSVLLVLTSHKYDPDDYFHDRPTN
jgi:hypothetical protein